MKYKLSRIASFIDKYGILTGIWLYAGFKLNCISEIKIPGISRTFFLRKGTSDAAIFDQVFLQGEYDISFSFVPYVIVDAGAHIGLFSIAMKNKFPEAKIICIEPGRDNHEVLKKNLRGYKNIELVYAGLWNSNTMLNVTNKYQKSYSALVTEEDPVKGNVPGITVDTIMKEYDIASIDIMKIDIETSEAALFLENYNQWLPKVRIIIIELHDWLEEGCSKPFFEAINKSFTNYSYAVSGENTIIENKDRMPGV